MSPQSLHSGLEPSLAHPGRTAVRGRPELRNHRGGGAANVSW